MASLKRVLLAQLRVREFSQDSQFCDPCLSYVLRDVICSYCSTCRDLDLLRDESLICEPPPRRWICTHCHNKLNTEEVENRLLEEAERLSVSFLLQDFRCAKTHRVSRRLGSAVSELCDPLVMDLSQSVVRRRLDVLAKVAAFHQFELLLEAVQDLLQPPMAAQ